MKIQTAMLLSIFAMVLVTIAQTLAQTNAPPVFESVDEKMQGFFAVFSAWKFMLIPLVAILVKAAKKWLTMIPTNLLPWIAPIIGGFLDYAATKAGIWVGSGEVGVMMGALAVWFHQTNRETTALITHTDPDTGKPLPK